MDINLQTSQICLSVKNLEYQSCLFVVSTKNKKEETFQVEIPIDQVLDDFKQQLNEQIFNFDSTDLNIDYLKYNQTGEKIVVAFSVNKI